MPSAPTTRSNLDAVPPRNRTSTPSARSVNRLDAVAEDVLDAVPGPLVQQPAEVAAEHLQVAADELGGNDRAQPAVGIDDVLVGRRGADAQDVVPTVHPLQHRAVGGALEIHGLTARAHRRRLLHDRDLMTLAGQPECHGRTGDARPRDQHIHQRSPSDRKLCLPDT
jgi:hypothetical protein